MTDELIRVGEDLSVGTPFPYPDDFLKQAEDVIGDPVLVWLMLITKDRFGFVEKIYPSVLKTEHFFQNEYDCVAFKRRHSLKLGSGLGPLFIGNMEDVLVAELNVTYYQASTFIECMRRYIRENVKGANNEL